MTALRRDPIPRAVDISVVVVTYNSRTFIDACLDSVQDAQGSATVEVIVVDNASLDGTADYIEHQWPQVQVIRTGWNSGFSRGCNAGASQSAGRWLFFLNGDATVQPGTFAELLEVADRDPAGIFAPRVVHPDGSDQQTARSFPTASAYLFGRRSPLTRLLPNNRFSARYLSGANPTTSQPYEVDWVSGAALFIDRHQFREIGGFDEGFFMYWEDADLCRRIKDNGGTVWCVPTGEVVHAEGSSAATTSPKQNKRFHASAYRYACKHILRGPAVVLRPAARTALTARRVAVGLMNSRSTKAAPQTGSLGARS